MCAREDRDSRRANLSLVFISHAQDNEHDAKPKYPLAWDVVLTDDGEFTSNPPAPKLLARTSHKKKTSVVFNMMDVRDALGALTTEEYEEILAEKIAEEQAKLPPTPEFLPDLPYTLAHAASGVAGGEYNEHYARAYKTLTEQRAAFADMSTSLRAGLRESYVAVGLYSTG
jgi:hypothetical protein